MNTVIALATAIQLFSGSGTTERQAMGVAAHDAGEAGYSVQITKFTCTKEDAVFVCQAGYIRSSLKLE